MADILTREADLIKNAEGENIARLEANKIILEDGAGRHSYSTDEKIVGTWLDGRNIYEKTVEVTALPNRNTLNVVLCADTLINASGFCVSINDPTSVRLLPFAGGGSNDIRVDQADGYIRIMTFADWSTYKGYLTYQYVKGE